MAIDKTNFVCVRLSMHCIHPQVKDEWASGKFILQPSDEDIHTANERRLKVCQKCRGGGGDLNAKIDKGKCELSY